MPHVTVNGVSLYYEEHGAGDAIVGVHGSLSSAALWEAAAQELARFGRAIVYDRRGCSRSERPEPYATDVHQHAEDAAALIDALGAAPAVVIGRSYGGAVALDLALRHPDRVRALVQLEGDGAIALSPVATAEAARLLERVEAAVPEGPDAVVRTTLDAVAGEGAWRGLPDELRAMFAANVPALLAELRAGYPEVTVDDLRRVRRPTLLVAAADSALDYTELVRVTAGAIPGATVETVDGGHLISPSHPVVLAFVEAVLARTAAQPA